MTYDPPSIAYGALSPMLIVLGAAVVGVLLEAVLPRAVRFRAQLGLALVAGAGAAITHAQGPMGPGGFMGRGPGGPGGPGRPGGPMGVIPGLRALNLVHYAAWLVKEVASDGD